MALQVGGRGLSLILLSQISPTSDFALTTAVITAPQGAYEFFISRCDEFVVFQGTELSLYNHIDLIRM